MNSNQSISPTRYYDSSGTVIYKDAILIATIDGKTEAYAVKYNNGIWYWGIYVLEDVVKNYHTRVVGQIMQQPYPSLNDLHKSIMFWSREREIHKADPMKQMVKLMEEIGELANGLNKGNDEVIVDSIGDVFVVLTILCQQLNIDLTSCVAAAYNEIKDRKGQLVNGIFVKEQDLKKE